MFFILISAIEYAIQFFLFFIFSGAIYCSQRKMRMFLPENSSENDDFYNLGKDWQYETTMPNKFWLRIRYYQESINLWLDKEIERAYEDQISSRNHAFQFIWFIFVNKIFMIDFIFWYHEKKFFQLGFK